MSRFYIALALPLFTVIVKSYCATTKYFYLYYSLFFAYKKTCPFEEQVHFEIFCKNTNMAL